MLVTYVSDYGHTTDAAKAIGNGAASISMIDVRVIPVKNVEFDDIVRADALIIGSPVHMGTLHWEAKRFIDESLGPLWTQDRMIGKVGAVFCTGGGLGGAGGGCELTMLSLLTAMAELGMIMAPLPKTSPSYSEGGLHWGPYIRCATEAGQHIDLPQKTIPLLRAHGANVARVARRLTQPTATV